MNTDILKRELIELMVKFFDSNDINEANTIKESIYHKVLSLYYTDGALRLVSESLNVWKMDISNYLTHLADNSVDQYSKQQAFLALRGIINLIEISSTK